MLHSVCFQFFPAFSYLLPSAIFKHGVDTPWRAKDVEWFGEAVIVDEASVHGEYAHEQDQVAPAEKGVPDLQGEKPVPVIKVPAVPPNGGHQPTGDMIVPIYVYTIIHRKLHVPWAHRCLCVEAGRISCQISASWASSKQLHSAFGRLDDPFIKWRWWAFSYAHGVHQLPGTHLISAFLGQKVFLVNDHPEGKAQHDGAVATIPKHHRKQEGECNDSVWSCRKERTRSWTLPKQKGVSRAAVHPIRPFFTAATLKGLHNPSPSHLRVRYSAELALSQEIFSNCMTCIFLAILAFISCLTVMNTMCIQLHSVLQQKNVFEVCYHVSQPQQSEFMQSFPMGPHF